MSRRLPRLLAAAFAAALAALPLRPVNASIWDGDAAVVTQLIGILSQLEQSYRTLHQQLDQLDTSYKLAVATAQQLRDVRSFTDLKNSIDSTKAQYEMLRGQADFIKYNINDVRSQFDRLFPGAKNIPASQLNSRRGDWYHEVSGSARAAMTGQALIDNTAATSQTIRQLVDLSRASASQMQQLQIMNQMLGKLTMQVGDLVRVLATSNRAVASHIATQNAEQELGLEHNKKLWDLGKYKQTSAAPKVRSRLPKPGSAN